MTPSELRSKTPTELTSRLNDLREELFKLKLQHSTGRLQKSDQLKKTRKEIARVLTISNELKEKSSS